MEKPRKRPFFKFYAQEILSTWIDGWENLMHLGWLFVEWFAGLWYCEHCTTYHGRRVDKHILIYVGADPSCGNAKTDVCHLGLEAARAKEPIVDSLERLRTAVVQNSLSTTDWAKQWEKLGTPPKDDLCNEDMQNLQ